MEGIAADVVGSSRAARAASRPCHLERGCIAPESRDPPKNELRGESGYSPGTPGNFSTRRPVRAPRSK